MKRISWALLALVVSVRLAAAAPVTHPPALAMYHDDPLDNPSEIVQASINGTGFGDDPQAGTHTLADCGLPAGGSFAVVSTGFFPAFFARGTVSAEVSHWTDSQVVVLIPKWLGAYGQLGIRICTPAGHSLVAQVTKWQYDHFSVLASPHDSAPLALAIDAGGNVWLNEETHSQFKRMSPTGQWTSFNIPQVEGPGIFARRNLSVDTQTRHAVLGEAMFVDTQNRVWLTESGSGVYDGAHPNHSRLVMYDQATQQTKVFNVPGDRNGLIGAAWDAPRNKIWFVQDSRVYDDGDVGDHPNQVLHRARLTSFVPQYIPSDGLFDFAPPGPCSVLPGAYSGTCSTHPFRECVNDQDCVLANKVCPPGTTYDYWCFHEWEIPDLLDTVDVRHPSHVMVHSDGTIWYSAYWGGMHIGRFNPSTGVFQQYPLPDSIGQDACEYDTCGCFNDPNKPPCSARCCSYILGGTGPWNLVEEADGDVVFAQQEQPAIARFSYSGVSDPACTQLDANGQNPCITNYFVPNFDLDAQIHHSVERDGAGNVWISQFQKRESRDDCSTLTSVGYLSVTSEKVLMFPPISFYPFGGIPCTAFGGAELAFDPTTGAMYFADFWRDRIGRLKPKT